MQAARVGGGARGRPIERGTQAAGGERGPVRAAGVRGGGGGGLQERIERGERQAQGGSRRARGGRPRARYVAEAEGGGLGFA